jgi:hypothetical protein
MTLPPGRICVTFGFVKGALMGQSITAQVAADVSVLCLKSFLIQTHNACDPSTYSLKFVCQQTLQVLSDEEMVGSLHLPSIDVCVNVTRKTPLLPVAAAVLPLDDTALPFPSSCLGPPPPLASIPCPATATDALPNMLHDGARVRIEGLRSKPELNGCCGSICGAFDRPLADGWSVLTPRLQAPTVATFPSNLRTCRQSCCTILLLTLPSILPIPTFVQHQRRKPPIAWQLASALQSTMSSSGDDTFITGVNLSRDQQTKMREALHALQRSSASGEVDMSSFLSVYENVRKPEDKAIDSILPISTMVCLHR